MKFLIQKYGGTSVNTPEARELVASRVIAAREEGYTPVVVVSAIGRLGEPYATDTLINFVHHTYSEVSPREMDLLMSCGEIISGITLTAAIQKAGHQAIFLTGAQAGIITDHNFNEARIIKIKPENVIRYAREDKVVIVAGFQGVTEEGDITTLGRGGSDTTAAALGVALGAQYVDIYTDVEGVMTADPRIVGEAQTLKMVTYDEICQLAYEGAKVIHPRAVEIVMQANIPLRVKSIFSNAPGTLVTSLGEVYKGTIDITRDRVITGITQISNLTQFKINTEGEENLKQQRRLFSSLALAGISLDFINVNSKEVMFTVKEELAHKASQILENVSFTPEVNYGCAKVATVGAGMSGVPGVMAGIVEALTKEEIQILQANDSYTTIWVLVKQEDMEKAIRALHRQFVVSEKEKR
ncbi:MAG: aspartate kinase [Peptococcaceae bacterium]